MRRAGRGSGDDDDDGDNTAAAVSPPPAPLQQQRAQLPPPSRTNRRRTSSTAGVTDGEEEALLARGIERMSFRGGGGGGGGGVEEGEEEEEDFEEDEEEERWQQQQQQRQQRQQRRRPSPAFGPLYSLSDDFKPSSSPQGVADASEDPSWLDSRSRLAFAGSVLGGSSSSASPSSSRPSSSAPPPPPPRRPRLESMQGLPLDAQERGAVEGLLSAFAGALDDGDFVRPVSPRPSSSSSASASASERDEFGNRAARFELCPGADPGVAELTSRLLPLASAASDVARFAHVSRRRRAGGVSAGAGGEAAKVLCEWRRHVARVEHASLSTACGRGGIGAGKRGR